MWKILLLLVFWGCSSNDMGNDVDNSDTIEKDYLVRDASSNIRPGWTSEKHAWLEKNDMPTEKYKFFSFFSEPKVSREIACSLAKANARADIASEIVTFLEKSVAESKEGEASIDPSSPDGKKLREFMEVTLAEKTQAMIHGASVERTYWEKRQYKTDMGAKNDFVGYSCAVLIKMNKKTLKRAVDKAVSMASNVPDDPETKANVKKALNNVAAKFISAP